MISTTTISTAPIMTFLPRVHPSTPNHNMHENSTVLDLCVRKRSLSPTYPYDCSRSPNYIDLSSSPKSTSGLSESSDVSSMDNKDINSNFHVTKIHKSRPFKAYPKDPLSITLMGSVTESILGKDSTEAYAAFRRKMLEQVQATHNETNKNMRRTQSQNVHNSDPTYWEKRKKNNEAAKRSRDARKAKEDEIAIRCAFLEQENAQMKFRLATALTENDRLKRMFYR